MSESMKKMLASYGRSVLAGAATLYMAGVTDPKDLVYSLVAALAPVALRALNPNDTAFGKMPDASEVEAVTKKAVAKKAPKKKK